MRERESFTEGQDHDPLGHEERLAGALSDLVRQVDIADYRDSLGHPLKNNLAFLKAQQIVDEFCLTHEEICRALKTHGSDVGRLTRHFATRH